MNAIGWVGGTAIPRERLDERVRELRAGRLAGRLPTLGSKEDRQFLRWTAQVLLTEELCRRELARWTRDRYDMETLAAESGAAESGAAESGAAESGGAESEADLCRDLLAVTNANVASASQPHVLSQAESLHLGSINAAAWLTEPAVSELFDLITTASLPAEPSATHRTWYRVVHSVGPTPLAAAEAIPHALGWTTLADVPPALAGALRAISIGTRVGPIRTGIGWHFATVTATELRADPQPGGQRIDPPRLAAFNRWLDQRRRALVVHAPGFEHPGDPAQPDNTHRH